MRGACAAHTELLGGFLQNGCAGAVGAHAWCGGAGRRRGGGRGADTLVCRAGAAAGNLGLGGELEEGVGRKLVGVEVWGEQVPARRLNIRGPPEAAGSQRASAYEGAHLRRLPMACAAMAPAPVGSWAVSAASRSRSTVAGPSRRGVMMHRPPLVVYD
jgi:hypothetical protein